MKRELKTSLSTQKSVDDEKLLKDQQLWTKLSFTMM